MRTLIIALLLALLARPCLAAVAYDSVGTGTTGSGSIPSFNVNVVTATKVACIVGITLQDFTVATVTSVTIGGVSASAIAGTTSTYSTGSVTVLWGAAIGDVNGNQAVIVTLSNSFAASAKALCATGVNQSSPFSNGTEEHSIFSIGTAALVITSAANDMSADFIDDASGNAVSAPTQTQRVLGTGNVCAGAANCMGMSTAAGAASTTHQWTTPGGDGYGHSGVNFKADTGGAVLPKRLSLLGVG